MENITSLRSKLSFIIHLFLFCFDDNIFYNNYHIVTYTELAKIKEKEKNNKVTT